MNTQPLIEELKGITFYELVEYGKANTTNIVNGMPWSFSYEGHPITHENDECYLIPIKPFGSAKFTPTDILISSNDSLHVLSFPATTPPTAQEGVSVDDIAEDILSGYESVSVMTDYDHYEDHYHKDCVLQAIKEALSLSSTTLKASTTEGKDGWVWTNSLVLEYAVRNLMNKGDLTIEEFQQSKTKP